MEPYTTTFNKIVQSEKLHLALKSAISEINMLMLSKKVFAKCKITFQFEHELYSLYFQGKMFDKLIYKCEELLCVKGIHEILLVELHVEFKLFANVKNPVLFSHV